MNIWHDVDNDRIKASDFLACIEIPKGSKKKYELDKETGMIILDRILYTSTHYPANYGFIPRTYSQDKDPLDVLVLCNEAFDPLVLVKCFPIGVVRMVDQSEADEKIIAVCQNDPSMNGYKDISVYKSLEGKQTVVTEVLGAEEARETIQEAIDAYNQLYLK